MEALIVLFMGRRNRNLSRMQQNKPIRFQSLQCVSSSCSFQILKGKKKKDSD
jgi:hypothetical protein